MPAEWAMQRKQRWRPRYQTPQAKYGGNKKGGYGSYMPWEAWRSMVEAVNPFYNTVANPGGGQDARYKYEPKRIGFSPAPLYVKSKRRYQGPSRPGNYQKPKAKGKPGRELVPMRVRYQKRYPRSGDRNSKIRTWTKTIKPKSFCSFGKSKGLKQVKAW